MVLIWREKIRDFIDNHEVESSSKLNKASKTSDKTFTFCAPYLLAAGVVSQDELDRLTEIRRQRNVFAHEGYNSIWSLHYSDIEEDLEFIDKMAFEVEQWKFETPITKPPFKIGDSIRATVSPRFFTNVIRNFDCQIAGTILHYELDEYEINKRKKKAEQVGADDAEEAV